MAISLGVTSNLTIDQNLAVGGSATITSGLTLSSTTASSLLYGNTLKAVSSVILSSNLSLTTGTLALAAALTGINSITASTALTLNGGSSGASLLLGAGATPAVITSSVNGLNALTVRNTNAAYYSAIQFNDSSNVGQASFGWANASAAFFTSSVYFTALNSSPILFCHSTTERMRLSSNGNFLIGTTADMANSGGLKIAGTTAATTTTSGALIVAGGVGVSGAAYFGGDATVTKANAKLTLDDTSNTAWSLRASAGYLTFGNVTNAIDPLSLTGSTLASAVLNLASTKSASNSYTGALVVGNGLVGSAATNVAIGAGAIVAGGGITSNGGSAIGVNGFLSGNYYRLIENQADSTNGGGIIQTLLAGTWTNTLTMTHTGNATLRNALTVSGTTASTGVGSGALQVAGGIGVSGAGYFGGVINTVSSLQSWSTANGSAVNTGVSLRNTAGASPNNALPSILWDTGSLNWARIDGTRAAGGGYGGSLRFWTAETSASNEVQRMTIDSTGVVSITATTSASSSIVGALTIGNGSAATNVAIGAGSMIAGANVQAVGNVNVGAVGSDFAAGRLNIVAGSDTVPALSFGGSAYGFGILEKTDGDLYFARRQGSTTNTTWMSVSRATGAAAFTGNVGIGGAAATDRKLQISGNTTAGADQFGTVFLGTFSNSATSSGTVEYLRLATQAAAYTMASGVTLQLVSPNIGAGSAVTTHTAISIQNPGAAGITNAYGIDIAAVSGAATTNIGLRNAGTTVLTNATVSTLSTNGALVVTGGVGVGGTSVFGDTVTVSKSQNATTSLSVQNGNGGTASASVLSVGNDTSFSRGNLYAFGTGYTTSNQYVAGSVLLEATAAPGLGISGTNGGPVKIWNNAGLTATFAATGITFASAVTMTGSLFFNTGTNTPIVPSYMNVGAATGADENLLSFGNAARSGVLRGNQSGSNIAMWSFSYGSSGPTYLEGVRVTAGLSLANTYLNVYGTAAATSTASGALQVAGGAGFAKAIYVNQNTFIDGAAGTFRSLQYTAANVNRWGIGASNAAESGSNVGSDLIFNRWSDAGADLGTVLTLTRSTGAATFTGQVTISSAAPYQLLTATAGTNYAYTEYINTGNNLRIGLENSAGASIVPGAPAYAAFIASVGARSLVFATNNIVRQTIDSAGATTFTSAVTINSGGLYATGAASTFDANAVATDLVLTLRTLTAGSASSRSTITNKAASGLIEFNSDAGSNGTGNGYDFKARGISRLSIDSVGAATFVGTLATGGAASIGVAVSTGLGFNVNLNPGTLTYGAANAWIGARIRPARAATTGNAFAISGQLEVTSGTQTSGATFISEAPSGTITNHTYFYANSSGSRVVPTGNYSFYAESAAGAAYIGNATASTGIGFGALQVAGGIYVGAASVFAGDVAFNVGRNTVGDAFYSYSANVFTFGSGNAAQSARIFSGGNAALTFDTSRAATFAGTVTTLGRILAIGTIRTAAYTVTTSDHVVVCNNATTPFTVTLIAASSNTGRQFIIKNKGVATITMDATSLGTIDGSNTMTLTTNQAATLVSDGVQWNRI